MKHPTPYAVKCHGDSVPEVGSCGIVYLQREGQHGYLWQMNNPNNGWYCPNCGSTATWQDDIYEEAMEDSATHCKMYD
jgi:hypothetical protein